MPETNLIDIIENQMTSDDSNREKQSAYLLEAYEESTDQSGIDKFLIALCGWSLDTIQRIQRTSLLPITHAEALRLWSSGNEEIFRLYHDDSEGLVENVEELVEAIAKDLDLGIEGEQT